MNVKLLFDHYRQEVDPFDPQNPLIFSAGLLTGTAAISSSRLHVTARSPLTGLIGSSNVGNDLGPELRACGFLSLILLGRSSRPVYLRIEDERISIEDAVDLWGLDTWETQDRLKSLLGDDRIRTAVVGPAGEKLVRIACIMVGRGHAAGRTGLGAVMASKNVKAMVVRAAKRPRIYAQQAKEAIDQYRQRMSQSLSYEPYRQYGSSNAIQWTQEMGALATRNYRQVLFEGVPTADGSNLEQFKTRYKTCYRCPVHCKAELKITEGRHAGFVGERPDYEPLVSWGPKCGNADGKESVYLHNMADKWGVDSVEAGSLLAFAMDLYDRRILSKEKTGGLELVWGNHEAMEKLLDQLATRSSWLGNTLAEGIVKAAAIIGGGAEEFAHNVKGLSMTAMDPRGFKGSALGYAVSNRGGDFTSVYARPEYSYTPERAVKEFGTAAVASRLSEEGKALLVRTSLCVSAVVDALGICKIPHLSLVEDYGLRLASDLVKTIIGWEMASEELFKVGERIINAERIFNIRHGAGREMDNLPRLFMEEPVRDGVCKGSVVQLGPMLDEFYCLMGWDEKGIPTREKLQQLDLHLQV